MPAATPRRVLIVDDNLSLAENIAEILQIDGHITRFVGSAEEAFPNAVEDEPDVVVTDYRNRLALAAAISGVDLSQQLKR